LFNYNGLTFFVYLKLTVVSRVRDAMTLRNKLHHHCLAGYHPAMPPPGIVPGREGGHDFGHSRSG
jgi:hypothetical protein